MTKPKRTRASNFNPIEDEQLARSWIEISKDIITNNSQTIGSFWVRVQEAFKGLSGMHKEVATLTNRLANPDF
ncbi:hypothetical protein PtB15_9B645 [Puccinia triticina]|nr:hypothetical protein PtB15_9B645 [Puccinia triticina]